MNYAERIRELESRLDRTEKLLALQNRVIMSWHESFTRGNLPQPKSVSDTVQELIRIPQEQANGRQSAA